MTTDTPIGPARPCGCFDAVADCPYLRRVLSRGKRTRGVPCAWMTDNGFVRSAPPAAETP